MLLTFGRQPNRQSLLALKKKENISHSIRIIDYTQDVFQYKSLIPANMKILQKIYNSIPIHFNFAISVSSANNYAFFRGPTLQLLTKHLKFSFAALWSSNYKKFSRILSTVHPLLHVFIKLEGYLGLLSTATQSLQTCPQNDIL